MKQEIFTKNKILRDSSKTPFTKDARDKAILYADKQDGIFPDKAQILMNKIAGYYGDTRKKINSHDVDEYAVLAKELFNNGKENAEIIYRQKPVIIIWKRYNKERCRSDCPPN